MKKDYLKRKSYPTDLTDSQWAIIAPLFKGMREYKYSKRELLNAVLYVVDNGCKWRALPHEFPAWQTVYSFFRRAKETGLWDNILQHLVEPEEKQIPLTPLLIHNQWIQRTKVNKLVTMEEKKQRS